MGEVHQLFSFLALPVFSGPENTYSNEHKSYDHMPLAKELVSCCKYPHGQRGERGALRLHSPRPCIPINKSTMLKPTGRTAALGEQAVTGPASHRRPQADWRRFDNRHDNAELVGDAAMVGLAHEHASDPLAVVSAAAKQAAFTRPTIDYRKKRVPLV